MGKPLSLQKSNQCQVMGKKEVILIFYSFKNEKEHQSQSTKIRPFNFFNRIVLARMGENEGPKARITA